MPSFDSENSDLSVKSLSRSLQGRKIDFIVSGSIGAIESPRLVRALRRLGAQVQPWLTDGGAQFITPTALEWAANCPVRQQFSGTESHIANGDACIVAPASTHIIAKLAWGDTDTPTSALVTSYLGMQKPVLILPSMHDSLWEAPNTQRNIETLKTVQSWVTLLAPRIEEGKQKMPAPAVLADEISYQLNKNTHRVLVTMGSTRGYIDDVRYISNYSSGALGTLVTEELHRYGFQSDVVCGPCPVSPKSFVSLTHVMTNQQMLEKIKTLEYDAAVCAASVLDFVPAQKETGKIRSTQKEISLTLKQTEKIIAQIKPIKPIKVGFKLETELSEQAIKKLTEKYTQQYGLSCFVINKLSDVDQKRHKAILIEKNKPAVTLDDKRLLAQSIVKHIRDQFS